MAVNPSAASLFDFGPLLHMMLLGAVIALGPLSWVWLRHRGASVQQRLRVLTLLTLFLTFDLVVFGAFTRLTDSGLGCPDWPGCYGHMSPVGAKASITAAQDAMPTGPVTHSKAWVEMIHRYLATAVGVLITVIALASWVERKRLGSGLGLPLVTLLWVCLQGAFGALTVTMKLFPLIVTLHLLGGLVLLALLRLQVAQHPASNLAPQGAVSPQVRTVLWALFGLLWVQIALGGWVSTNYAVLACSEFPTCQGSWWPEMDFHGGFTLWRGLGVSPGGEAIAFSALTAIHYVHRLSAYIVLTGIVWAAWLLWRAPGLRGASKTLMALAAWQLISGLANVVLDWPMLAALAHTAGAAALVVVLTGALVASRPALVRNQAAPTPFHPPHPATR